MVTPPKILSQVLNSHSQIMIFGRIFPSLLFKSPDFPAVSLHHHSFVPSRFNFNDVSHQIEHVPAKPISDLGRIREPDDAAAVFQEIVTIWPRPSMIDFTELLSVVVDTKQYSLALHLFDEMLQSFASLKRRTLSFLMAVFRSMVRIQSHPSVTDYNKFVGAVVKIKQYCITLHLFDEMLRMDYAVDDYIVSIAVNCFCLNGVDLGFVILGCCFKRGYESDVVTFNTLIKGLIFVEKILESAKLSVLILHKGSCKPIIYAYTTIIG